MSSTETDIGFVSVPPDAGTRARRTGTNQAPPEELYGHGYQGEAQPEGDTPDGAVRASQSAPASTLVTAQEFATDEEDMGEALLGQPKDMLLPAGGTLFMYGKGGAGKTTLTLDALCHLASGTTWLGQDVTAPVKIILVENEGPRALLRQRIRAKLDSWEGEPWAENVLVWVEPWMGFSFREKWCRQQLADYITEHEAELVVVGPLAAIGALGGGTPDEVSEFNSLLEKTRALTPLEIAFWIIHHENKAGDVSGAWDRLPDTLVHVTGQGNGRTHVHWRKARWSSLHDTALDLTWNGGFSYNVSEKPDTEDDQDVLTRVRELFQPTDTFWRVTESVRMEVQGRKPAVTRALETLAASGHIEERRGNQLPGLGFTHNARCWRHSAALDPTLDQPLDPAVNKPGSSGSSQGAAGPRWNAGPPAVVGGGTPQPAGPAVQPANAPFSDDDFPF